jgi:hypothetical protein
MFTILKVGSFMVYGFTCLGFRVFKIELFIIYDFMCEVLKFKVLGLGF